MKKEKNIEDSAAWKAADWDYAGLMSQEMMPLLSEPLTGQKRIDYLNEIVTDCPEYYPALIDLGYQYIIKGQDEKGKKVIDAGITSLKTHFSTDDLIEVYYKISEVLETRLRFDLAIDYYQDLLDIEQDKAIVYDHIAFCYVYLGELEKAFETQKNALKLDDKNHRYYCNMGWIEMIRGNLDSAKTMLKKSLALNKSDEVTVNNYKVLNKLLENKELKNWEDYLLRETDYDYLDELEENEKFQKHHRQLESYNNDKIEAFKFDLMRNPTYSPNEKYDLLISLKYIFKVIQDSSLDEYFFNEDIAEVTYSFESIIHRAIIKTGDINLEIFNGIYDALLAYYAFLTKKKMISEYRSLEKEMNEHKKSLIEKMEKYNQIRHNDKYTTKEKEKIRDELFGADAYFPF